MLLSHTHTSHACCPLTPLSLHSVWDMEAGTQLEVLEEGSEEGRQKLAASEAWRQGSPSSLLAESTDGSGQVVGLRGSATMQLLLATVFIMPMYQLNTWTVVASAALNRLAAFTKDGKLLLYELSLG